MGSATLKKIIAVTAVVLLTAAGALFVLPRLRGAGSREDQIKAVKDAVRGRAMQCYIIEGSYPGSLEYLEENYGLAVNTDDYRIIYIAFAENLPPEIKVVPKDKK